MKAKKNLVFFLIGLLLSITFISCKSELEKIGLNNIEAHGAYQDQILKSDSTNQEHFIHHRYYKLPEESHEGSTSYVMIELYPNDSFNWITSTIDDYRAEKSSKRQFKNLEPRVGSIINANYCTGTYRLCDTLITFMIKDGFDSSRQRNGILSFEGNKRRLQIGVMNLIEDDEGVLINKKAGFTKSDRGNVQIN